MAISDLKDLYTHGLKDLHSACKQSLSVTRDMQEAASSSELKEALKAAVQGTEDGMKKIEKLLSDHGESAGGEHCKGMEGLVAEARKHALDEQFGDDDVRDASIIAQYQRLGHYAITGYGTLRTWAGRLNLADQKATLQEMLDSTYDGDVRMTEIAEGGVNRDAAR